MMATIFTMVSSVSTSPEMEGSILIRASLRISPMGMSEHGVEECKPAAAGEAPEHPLHLKERIAPAIVIQQVRCTHGVGNWLSKDGEG